MRGVDRPHPIDDLSHFFATSSTLEVRSLNALRSSTFLASIGPCRCAAARWPSREVPRVRDRVHLTLFIGWNAAPAADRGGERSRLGPGFQGVMATFSTPSRWLPKSSYAASMSSSLKRCVTMAPKSTRRAAIIDMRRRMRSLPPGPQRRDDPVVTKAGRERPERDRQVGRVDAEAVLAHRLT